ncbi:MAG: hypothetical protein L0220_13105, partial [Acidobacteria bacterium]|nr:hypothetical protein [Acidobacteriota bacterium]
VSGDAPRLRREERDRARRFPEGHPDNQSASLQVVWCQLFFSLATIRIFDLEKIFIVAPVGMWVTAVAVIHISTGWSGTNLCAAKPVANVVCIPRHCDR